LTGKYMSNLTTVELDFTVEAEVFRRKRDNTAHAPHTYWARDSTVG
jgi:hypothetical protein